MTTLSVNTSQGRISIATQDDILRLEKYLIKLEALLLLLQQKHLISNEELDDCIETIKLTDKLQEEN